jgi:hypothetical protein
MTKQKILAGLSRQAIDNPKGLPTPNLVGLIERTVWALNNWPCWNGRYVELLEEDVKLTRQCLDRVEGAIQLLKDSRKLTKGKAL